MAADLSYWMDIAGLVVAVFIFAVVVLGVCSVSIDMVTTWWRSPWMRLFRLGGVTTLRRKLNYPCTLCGDSMEAGEKVRTLSCDHAFHCGGSVKCANDIDQLLGTGPWPWISCPICHQYLDRVLPWKRPPPSLPAPSSSAPASTSTTNLEEGLLPSAHDETLQEASSSAPAPPTSTPDLE